MPFDVVILGCGLVGRKRAQAIGAIADLRVRAVYDIDTQRAAALAALLPDAEVATSAESACRLAVGGLAVVAARHDALAPLSHVALGAGCHVLVEKPGARDVAEFAAVAEVARRRDLVLRVGFNHRFHPAVLKARELLQDRLYGDIRLIRARYGHGGRLGYEKEWRADRLVSGGGEMLDQGVHLVDLVRFLAGGVELAYASTPTLVWDMDVEDNAFLHLRLDHGGHAWLHASWTEWKNLFSFEITCRTAKLDLAGLGGSYGPERLALYELGPSLGPPFATTWEWQPGDASWGQETVDVLAEIAGEKAIGAGIDDTLAVLSIVQKAYRG